MQANGGNLYTAQLSVRSGDSGYSDDLLPNAQAAKHNITIISNDTTLDDEVFNEPPPIETPPKHGWRCLGDIMKGLIGSKDSLKSKDKSGNGHDDGFHSNTTSAMLSDYSQIAGMQTPESVGYKTPGNKAYNYGKGHQHASADRSGATSGVGSLYSLPPYMLAAVAPAYQNIPMGEVPNTAESETSSPEKSTKMPQPTPYIVLPQGNIGQGQVPFVALPQGQVQGQPQGQKSDAGQGQMPYVILPPGQGHPQGQGSNVPYVWLPGQGQGHPVQGQSSTLGQRPVTPYVFLPTNSQQGQGQSQPEGQGQPLMSYVILPNMGQGQPQPQGQNAPYVFIPSDEQKKPLRAFSPNDPVQSSSMEKLDEGRERDIIQCDISPIVSTNSESPFTSFSSPASNTSQAGNMAYIQAPDMLSQSPAETDSLLSGKEQDGEGEKRPGQPNAGYILVPHPGVNLAPSAQNRTVGQNTTPTQSSDYVSHQNAAVPLGQPVFLQPFCNLSAVIAQRQTFRPQQCRACRAPNLPRIEEVNSGQSLSSGGSCDLNSQSAAPVGLNSGQSESLNWSCDLNSETAVPVGLD